MNAPDIPGAVGTELMRPEEAGWPWTWQWCAHVGAAGGEALSGLAAIVVSLGVAAGSAFGTPSLPDPPPVSAPVLDDAHVLTPAATTALDRQLGQDNASSTVQIAVATLSTTGSASINAYAQMLFNSWGIGHSSSNDGVLVLVAINDRKVRIQTGLGLANRLPTAWPNRSSTPTCFLASPLATTRPRSWPESRH